MDSALKYLQRLICHKTQKKQTNCPVGFRCRIHRLYLCRNVRPPKDYPGYDTKQSDDKFPVMLEIWAIRCTHSLPSLTGPLYPGVVALDRVLS